jgi:hypothetical protein
VQPQSGFWRRIEPFVDSLILFLATAALIRPLFKARYLAFWGSIESTFIADARFLIEHWPHPQWQPLWYTGTRFDYIYPPALRYGTALTSRLFGFLPVKAYHVYTAFFYCVGIVGVYFLIRTGTRSRLSAYLGAAAAALISPSFLFLKVIRQDSWSLAPQRLGVLVKYGEGPHITAVALLPFALAFAWRALDRRKTTDLALAAVFCAAVVAHNFYGATSLAIFYSILVWSMWVTRRKAEVLARAVAIPVLTYGLEAVWLTPSYLKITSANLKLVAPPANAPSIWIGVGVALVFAAASWLWASSRPDRAWQTFVYGSTLCFSLIVLGYNYFHLQISGDPFRVVPELDLTLILGALVLLAWLWNRSGHIGRASAVVIALAGFATSIGYVRHAWSMFPLGPDYRERVEYRIPEWISKNIPDARVHAVGSVRFWFDAWQDLAQLGGGSEQGLLNANVEAPQWEVTLGPSPQPAVLWLQCMGVDAVYVSDKRSQEVYKDFANPAKFTGVLPVLYDDGQGNAIYGVPRRFTARARVVETAKISATLPARFGDDVERLRAYADVIERGPDSPATLVHDGPDAMRVHVTLAPGQSVVVQESYDRAWHAWSGGRPLTVRKDAMGFIVVDAPTGLQDIALAFVMPFENRIGATITAVSMLIVLGLVAASRRKRGANGGSR